LPHLKLGCIRDYFKILGESQDNNPRWSKTEFTYRYPKAIIEYWGADNQGKASGPRRDIFYVNEGNNVPWSIVEAADVRTSKFTIVDWNPTSKFWVHEYESDGQMVPGWRTDSRFGVLPQTVIENIESKRDKDPNWWNIFGLGLLGKIEGLVYPAFTQCDKLPDGTASHGLDFGFTNDPAVLVKDVIVGGNLYSQELIYERHLTNDDIARKMILLGVKGKIRADAAEPKSIEELNRLGKGQWSVEASEKGPGSVEFGHQRVRQFYQFWTKDSVNCIREQRNFRYLKNALGALTDNTTHEYSHGMDARRYDVACYRGEMMSNATVEDMRPSHRRIDSAVMQSFRSR
jgi:phage terminase large subunit